MHSSTLQYVHCSSNEEIAAYRASSQNVAYALQCFKYQVKPPHGSKQEKARKESTETRWSKESLQTDILSIKLR